jgi:hypothetical protein
MSRKFVPFFLTTAFTVLLSGAAFARRPPALAEQQDAAARVLAQCPQRSTSGYRDTLAPSTEAEHFAVHLAARRRMANHSVITCAGESVHTGGGYREIFVRLQPGNTAPMVAILCKR